MAHEGGGVSLPLELLEHIIDILAFDLFDPNSRAALFSCTLVCKAFYNRASGHLISDIKLGRGRKIHGDLEKHVRLYKELEGLYDVLETSPSLAPRIKALTIETWFGGVSPPEDRELLLENPHIPLIFPKLSSITSFAWINHDMIFPWTLFSTQILEAFSNLMSTPTLSSLTFENIENLPADYITRCSNLERLRLVYVDHLETDHGLTSPPTDVDARREQTESQHKLHTMINRHAPDIMLHILSDNSISAFMFSKLRSLHMWMRNYDEVRAAWAVMQSASQSVEVLDIEDMSHFGYPTLIPGPIDLGILRKLHTIKMSCRIASGDGIILPMGISGLLSPPTSPSSIQDIEITIDWIDCKIGTEEDRLSVTTEPAWAALDQALSQLSTFPELRRIILNLRLGYGWSTPPWREWVSSTSSALADPPERIVAVKNHLLQLAGRLLPVTTRIPTVKTNINVLVYNSPYASNIAYY